MPDAESSRLKESMRKAATLMHCQRCAERNVAMMNGFSLSRIARRWFASCADEAVRSQELSNVIRNELGVQALVPHDSRLAALYVVGADRAWIRLRHRDCCRRAATPAADVDHECGLATYRTVRDRGVAMVLFSVRLPRVENRAAP